MEKWRELAIQLFPDRKILYSDLKEDLSSVLFDLYDEIIVAHRNDDINLLTGIYRFTAWCHEQKSAEPEYWNSAFSIFYEHLVEEPETYRAIPRWVKPEIFQDLLTEYEARLNDKSKYPGELPGTFRDLLIQYDRINGTSFIFDHPGPG